MEDNRMTTKKLIELAKLLDQPEQSNIREKLELLDRAYKPEWVCSECMWPVSICDGNPCKAVAQGRDVCAGFGDSIKCDAHHACCRHGRKGSC